MLERTDLSIKKELFLHSVNRNFFQEKQLIKILKALTKEKFFFKQADLFQFKQTNDLVSSKSSTLQELRAFLLSEEFISHIEQVTKLKLKRNQIDIAGTLYESTDYLLPHDDQLDSRKIAFFIYLSECEGGELNLYKEWKPTKIKPQFNTFAFFEVSEKSFHSVEEVIKGQRIAITGWYHAE